MLPTNSPQPTKSTDTLAQTQQLQEALADCGWEDAAHLRQQDVSEAFGFITDQLKLPLLTLKTDIYHAGKEEAKDDHKFITERLLDVAIPEEVQNDAVVTLEACLEDYFNNRVEVKRELQRRLTRETGLTRSDSTEKVDSVRVETTEVLDAPETPIKADSVIDTTPPKRPDFLHTRATSIFSQRKVYLDGKEPNAGETDSHTGRPRGTSIKKEVSMPAWQFINLIPWYTDAPDTATNDERQARAHFSSKRPMLGICLKRYKVSNQGSASRLNTRVDIPLEMSTPYFAVDGTQEGEDQSAAKFKLVLQSVVCHRGHSVNSGHYVSMVRLRGRAEPPKPVIDAQSPERIEPVRDEDTWLMMDDLATERVKTVNINEALEKESPYLLFYRVVPVGDSDADSDEPPPYSESEESGSIRLDHKVKPADAAYAYRKSLDLPTDDSRRTSLVFSDASEGTQPRGSMSVTSGTDHRSSLAFLNADAPSSRAHSIRPGTGADMLPPQPSHSNGNTTTQPTTPGDDDPARKDLEDASRTSSRSAKAPRSSTDGPGSGAGTREYNSKFFSKVTSRLSRDRLALPAKDAPEVVVNEIPLPSADAKQFLVTTDEVPAPTARLPSKERSKTMGFMNLSRRGSLSDRGAAAAAAAAADSGAGGKGQKEKRRMRGRSRAAAGREPDRDCVLM